MVFGSVAMDSNNDPVLYTAVRSLLVFLLYNDPCSI
uniref:Uncharacterized protein n=1 Tax=Anguilla anguilla TaxID=7936 RepID=A0A0E9XLR6_ANGAN